MAERTLMVLRPGFLGTILATTLGTSCGPSTERTLRTEAQIDTIAGVIEITNPVIAPELWKIERVVAIGATGLSGSPGPDEFGRVASVVADAGGNIYVADNQAGEVRVFDPTGQYLRTIGRPGPGPGEFGRLNSLAWVRDTLYALDPVNNRIQRFTASGVEAGSIPWIRLTGPPEYVRFHPSPDQRLYATGVRPPGLSGLAFLGFGDGEDRDSLYISESSNSPAGVTCYRSDGGISGWASPLNPRTLGAPGGDGIVLLARSPEYRISFITANEDTIRRIVRENPTRPVTDEAWGEVLDSLEAFRDAQPAGSSCEPATIPRPEGLPVIANLFFTYDGDLVVERVTEDGLAFDFHDREGRLYASAPAPERDRRIPPYFRDRRIYVATRGDLEIGGVAVYILEP